MTEAERAFVSLLRSAFLAGCSMGLTLEQMMSMSYDVIFASSLRNQSDAPPLGGREGV